MSIYKKFLKSLPLTALVSFGFVAGGFAQDTTSIVSPEISAPVILATSPAGGEMNVDLNSVIEITFSHDMDESSINSSTLLFHATYADTMYKERNEVMMHDQMKAKSATNVSETNWNYTTSAVNGTISYSNRVAVFTPDMELKEGAQYTFTVTNGVKSSDNIALINDEKWSFSTTDEPDSTYYSETQNFEYGTDDYGYSVGAPDTSLTENATMIDLGKAGHFVILAKESVSNDSDSRISGHIGEGSALDSIYIEKMDADSVQQKISGQVVVFQSNLNDSTTTDINEAIEDMMTAFTEASEMNTDKLMSHQNDSFSSVVMTAGVHEWSDSLNIVSDVTLSGNADDVWLIKVSDNLTIDENVVFTLTNGARADNVFWYIEGNVTIGVNAQFEGIILSMNEITLEKGAAINGRMYSQTSIILDDNTVTEPKTMDVRTSSSNK